MMSDSGKLCCGEFYQQEAVKFFLGDSWHPGGLELTRRLAEMLKLSKGKHLLDLACGQGTTASFLAENFGCSVTGLDSSGNGMQAAIRQNKNHSVAFVAGNAEALPFADHTFDAVLTECAFSAFADKERCASEVFRVLKPGGFWGLSDMLVDQPRLPEAMKGFLFQAGCIGEALDLAGYEKKAREAGFAPVAKEDVSSVLESWMEEIEKKLLGARLLASASNLPVTKEDFNTAQELLDQGKKLIEEKIIGYGILILSKSSK